MDVGLTCFIIILILGLGVLIGVGIGTAVQFDWKEYFKYRLEKDKMQLYSEMQYSKGE